MSVVRGRPPPGRRDHRREQGELLVAQGLAGAEVADQGSAFHRPHGVSPGGAAALLNADTDRSCGAHPASAPFSNGF
jgi:hypothetical protein